MKKHGQSHVAFVLAIGVTLSVVLLAGTVLYATISDYAQLTPEVSNLVSAVLGGVVGALAVYLGQDRKNDDQEDWPEDEPISDDEQAPLWPDESDAKPQQIEDDFKP